MLRNASALTRASKIERRASQISDPIERLRYLRQATQSAPRNSSRRVWRSLALAGAALAVITLGTGTVRSGRGNAAPSLRAARPTVFAPPATPEAEVWEVDRTSEYETYSNGLRIERRYESANEARSYSLISRDSRSVTGSVRAQPAGIVFHTTESEHAPFAAEHNRNLNRIGKELLNFVRQKRAYHFVIDRFGRVFRIVVESDAANHAGHSVWADERWLYMDLNSSFLGVAFEARSQTSEALINQAQLHAGRILVEMLRSKYHLPPQDCVTHAQVSVNPDNMQIGWHTDWGIGFPFQELGLPDNYEYPTAAVALFGFDYNDHYRNSTNPALWRGLARAEDQVRGAAVLKGVSAAEQRMSLQKQYREILTSLRQRSGHQEN